MFAVEMAFGRVVGVVTFLAERGQVAFGYSHTTPSPPDTRLAAPASS